MYYHYDIIINSVAKRLRPHRLAWPRTPAFHAGDRGSNPRGDANIKKGLSKSDSPFFMLYFNLFMFNLNNNVIYNLL